MHVLTGLRRRLAGRLWPPYAAPEIQAPARPPPAGHPDNPLTPALMARRRFAAALDALTSGSTVAHEALSEIAVLTEGRPGIAPEGLPELRLQGLSIAAERLPDDLTVRTSLAEALVRSGRPEEARSLAVSVIRQARPRDRLAAAQGAGAGLAAPALKGTFFHPVDLGTDFMDDGHKSAVVVAREMLQAHWPELQGKSVLDVGAFSGWFSFEAERRGAARVTANDFYSWMADFPRVWAWMAEQRAAGIEPDPYRAPYPVNDPDGLPGRAVFDLTHAALGSRVVPVFGPVETAALEPHDIVLLLGVLYHSEDPVGLLRRAFDLTRETLVIETLSFEYPANLDAPIWHFYGKGRPDRDHTTIWAPSSIGLRDALLKIGFSRVELLYGWDGSGFHSDWDTLEARLWVHAHR